MKLRSRVFDVTCRVNREISVVRKCDHWTAGHMRISRTRAPTERRLPVTKHGSVLTGVRQDTIHIGNTNGIASFPLVCGKLDTVKLGKQSAVKPLIPYYVLHIRVLLKLFVRCS